MTAKEIAFKAALQLNLPPKYVWEIYKSYWVYIRDRISSLPIKEEITEDEFSKLQPNINIPSLGKFHLDWERLKNKKHNERANNHKNKTSVHNSNNNS